MTAKTILMTFVLLRFGRYFIEKFLGGLNRQYYLNRQNQIEAVKTLGISQEDMDKSLAYAGDKYRFGQITGFINILLLMAFLVTGGLGWVETQARLLSGDYAADQTIVGLVFFLLLGLMLMIYGAPFSFYNTFVIEQRHGFNRQTKRGFFIDLLKGAAIGGLLGGLIIFIVLTIMEKAGTYWWVYAWFAMSGFSILTAWIYPTFLAPLFNKFSALEEGELKAQIYKLAERIHFKTDGLYIMDASKRSSHGNAYFTGVFGKKRIVLFDTLVESLKVKEIVAVLAHELGHFKLHHVRWMLLRGVLMTGVTFFLLSLFLPLETFYLAFKLDGVTNYAALVVFSLWFGLLDFLLQPFESYLSRRNEFAADRFALENVGDGAHDLGVALLKLREKSHSMPISHPAYSAFYYSHPPMIERLRAMGYVANSPS